MAEKKLIITHSGNFHSDDVFAVAALTLVLDARGEQWEVVRTRDEKLFPTGDYVIDVGFIDDPETNRFDHHQEGGAGKHAGGIPYSSLGLVWKKYGVELCGSQEIADKMEQKIVLETDAGDNGIPWVKGLIDGLTPYTIHDFIDSFRPAWQRGVVADFDSGYMQAMHACRGVWQREIALVAAKNAALEFLRGQLRDQEDPRLAVLEEYSPGLTELAPEFPELLFVVAPGQNDNWMIHTVRTSAESFENRRYLPKSWGGKTKDELSTLTGVLDAQFCHNQCFIAAAKTREGAVAMAKLALQ